MQKIDLREAAAFLANYAPKESDDPVVLMRGKKPIAVLLPTGQADMEIISLSFSPTFHDIIRRSKRSLEREGGISSEEIRREFGLPPFRSKRHEANGKKGDKPRKTRRSALASRAKTAK